MEFEDRGLYAYQQFCSIHQEVHIFLHCLNFSEGLLTAKRHYLLL